MPEMDPGSRPLFGETAPRVGSGFLPEPVGCRLDKRPTRASMGREWEEARMTKPIVRFGAVLAMVLAATASVAQISDDVVKIGVLTDMSGTQSDSTGPGSFLAARMAAED